MKASRIILRCPKASFCLFMIVALFAGAVYSSEPGINSKGIGISEFLNPDGSLDLEAVRQSGFEVDFDLESFNIRLDAQTGAPLFIAVPGSRDPEDQ